MSDYSFSDHSLKEIERRNLSLEMVKRTIERPDQRIIVREGRIVVQSRVQLSSRDYLLRVILDIDRVPAVVVTAYVTSKIGKYWRHST